MTNGTSSLEQALADMLAVLEEYLQGLPSPSVSVASVTERALAVGNRRGTERRGSFAVLALKGGRLEAVVRFQFLADESADVDAAVKTLQERLLAARDDLWAAGFLRIAAEETSLAEHVSGLDAWRKTADYRILYEFHYEDSEGAESLIARIPIDSDLEERDSPQRETTVVTDEMMRWDNQAAPALEVRPGVRHPFRVSALFIIAFLPDGWNGQEVTVSASVGGAVREQTFASVGEFRDAFDLEKEEGEDELKLKTVELGGNLYVAGRLVFPNADFPDPIMLKGGEDVFHISYAAPAFDNDAVVYLRVLS